MHPCVAAACTLPAGDPARNPGTCPDWEPNWQCFGLQDSTQSTEPHQPGQEQSESLMLVFKIYYGSLFSRANSPLLLNCEPTAVSTKCPGHLMGPHLSGWPAPCELWELFSIKVTDKCSFPESLSSASSCSGLMKFNLI